MGTKKHKEDKKTPKQRYDANQRALGRWPIQYWILRSEQKELDAKLAELRGKT